MFGDFHSIIHSASKHPRPPASKHTRGGFRPRTSPAPPTKKNYSSGELKQSHHGSPLHEHVPLAKHFPLWDPSPPPSSNIQVHTSGCTGPEFGIGYIGIYMGSGQQHACIYLCISLYRRCGHSLAVLHKEASLLVLFAPAGHEQQVYRYIYIYIYGVLAVIGHALGYCQCAE